MKKNILLSILVLFSITFFFLKCTKSPDDTLPTDPVEIELTSEQIALVESENSFAFDVFSRIMENEGSGKNIMISPLSISYALSMTLNGAKGETLDAMLEALRVTGLTPEELNVSYQKLTEALLSVDKRVIMQIANSVWSRDDFAVKEAFIDILETYYDAESKAFKAGDPQTPVIINNWIEDNTNGLIKDMIDVIPADVVMLLVNAIYFKGMWKYQFDKTETDDLPFYKNGNVAADVPTMSLEKNLRTYRGEDFILAELPYGQGNFVMDIILPDEYDGISSLLPEMNETSFSTWIGQAYETKVDLYLPRFKYKYKTELKDILTDMGMGLAFSDYADFTNIADDNLAISEVLHQTFVETNEEGTEAAAATVVTMSNTSAPADPMVFRADHPFIYIIRETTTNSIIFIGVVTDPLAE
ncbi:MAG: serpin family protein [Bacteroidota bacterium]